MYSQASAAKPVRINSYDGIISMAGMTLFPRGMLSKRKMAVNARNGIN
jgi:hypothetical protein